MMWYRGTPASLEQAKGMPIIMTNYSFGGGGKITLGPSESSNILRSLRFSSWSIYISLSRTRYWAQSSSLTCIPSFIIGMKFRSKTGSWSLHIMRKSTSTVHWSHKSRVSRPWSSSLLFFFQLGSWWSSSLGLLLLSSLEGAMIRLELRTTPDRNSSKQKHYENMIYKPRAIRGVL
jgi:hypothetical protein